jgi:phytanoyl-CoA hydroxylase
MSTNVSPSSEKIVDQFNEQGYLILRGFFEPQVIEDAREESGHLADEHIASLLALGKIVDAFPAEPFETRLARVYERVDFHPPSQFREELHRAGFFGLFFNRHLLDVVAGLLGPEVRLYPNYTVRPKLPESEATLVLWHQDAGYTEGEDADKLRMVNVWAPFVPANVANGCMQFIPGSHKLGRVRHESRKFYLEIAEELLKPHLDRVINVEVDPGDVVLFSNLLFHRGLPNTSKAIRWSSDWRYQDATQPTLRKEHGHLARSNASEGVVKTAEQWASLAFT